MVRKPDCHLYPDFQNLIKYRSGVPQSESIVHVSPLPPLNINAGWISDSHLWSIGSAWLTKEKGVAELVITETSNHHSVIARDRARIYKDSKTSGDS